MEEERGIDILGSGQFSGSGNNCLEFDPEKQKSWNLGVFITSPVASVACIVAIIFILAFKGHKRFVHRLTLYLMVAALLEAVASILAVIPVYHKHDNGTVEVVREGFEDFCAASGFLLELTAWIQRLVICWIVLYLVMVLVFKHSVNTIKCKYEACGLAVVLILPAAITWVPFVKGMYGWSRVGCWIKISESNCMYDCEGLTFMFVFGYGPELFIILAILILLGTIFTVICRRAVRQEQVFYQPSIYQSALKEVLPVLLYPLIYLVLWTTMVAIHIDDIAVNFPVQERNSMRNSMTPWLVYTVAASLRRLYL